MTLKISDIKKLFIHRHDVYAIQQPNGGYYIEKRPITNEIIKKHLQGELTIGVYCLDIDNTVKWACVDIDGNPSDVRRLEYESHLIYSLFPEFNKLLEFSGYKGYHVWIFFKNPIPAGYAQIIIKARLNRRNLLHHEVFPKQCELNENRKYGNLVKLPLAYHKVSKKFSEIIKSDFTHYQNETFINGTIK